MLTWTRPANDSAPISQQHAAQKRLSNEFMPLIQAVSPDSGTYLNEVSYRRAIFLPSVIYRVR